MSGKVGIVVRNLIAVVVFAVIPAFCGYLLLAFIQWDITPHLGVGYRIGVALVASLGVFFAIRDVGDAFAKLEHDK